MSDRLSPATTEAGRLQRACLAVLAEHESSGALPTSNRFVFYELVQGGIVSKRPTGKRRADQGVIDASYQLRERGIVPWRWIVDETRELYEWAYGSTIAEYLAGDALRSARLDLWDGEPPPLILCESRTFGGVLRRTLAPTYLCPVAATNGQCGGFLVTDVGPLLVGNERPVLYVGDLDLSGGQIEANTRRVLEREAGRDLDWRRLALTEAQAEQRGLNGVAKEDRRYRDGRSHLAVEVEALGQTVVTEIIREGLDALLPEPLHVVRERERREREALAEFLTDWRRP